MLTGFTREATRLRSQLNLGSIPLQLMYPKRLSMKRIKNFHRGRRIPRTWNSKLEISLRWMEVLTLSMTTGRVNSADYPTNNSRRIRSFFVAILPEQRQGWGMQMSKLVKPGGYLVHLLYPTHPPSSGPILDQPPWYATPEDVLEVLGVGWEVVVREKPQHSFSYNEGREVLLVLKRSSRFLDRIGQ